MLKKLQNKANKTLNRNRLYVTVLYDFIAEGLSELTVSEGQALLFLSYGTHETEDYGWSKCQNLQTKEIGYIPTAYHSEPTNKISIQDEELFQPSTSVGFIATGSRGIITHANNKNTTMDVEFKKASQHATVIAKKLAKRRELVKETIKTEETYVGNLQSFCNVFAKEAKELVSSGALSEVDYQAMFGHVNKILTANSYLLDKLKEQVQIAGAGNEESCAIGKIFQQTAPYLKIYTEYM